MFKKNTAHLQPDLFGLLNSLPENMQKMVEPSEEYHFYKLIFCNIKEDIFAALYSDAKSRPNAPINALVASLILMQRYHWSYKELFKQIRFHILVKIALGLDSIDAMPFCSATIFNFQNRLNKHFIETGENLLEQVFDRLTEDQLKTLKIKTDIQRTDSFAAASNIRNYSRLQLLVELILRIYRILSDEDKERFSGHFKAYLNKTSGQYIYTLQAGELPHEMEKIAQLYYWIDQNIKPSYSEYDIFKTFDRVYSEHFTVAGKKIKVKSKDQLTSSCVQSPDDLDAVYRKKNDKESRGQSINLVETANPENPINLITDVAINPVNKDDSKVLNERLDQIKEKTPDLDELHFDGAYGSPENDKKFEKHEIIPVQTAVKGSKPAVKIEIEQTSETEYKVSCPHQSTISVSTRKRNKAAFDLKICHTCPLNSKCQTLVMKKNRVYYFTHDVYLSKKRQKIIETIPPGRRKIRNNVEATVKEFTCKMPYKKLKVRGALKTTIFALTVAISVNFGRIYRYMQINPSNYAAILFYFFQYSYKWFLMRKNQISFQIKLFYVKIRCSLLRFCTNKVNIVTPICSL